VAQWLKDFYPQKSLLEQTLNITVSNSNFGETIISFENEGGIEDEWKDYLLNKCDIPDDKKEGLKIIKEIIEEQKWKMLDVSNAGERTIIKILFSME
jgi:hypothetical protein